MKTVVLVVIAVVIMMTLELNNSFAQNLTTETALRNENGGSGISFHRTKFTYKDLTVKYDDKRDLSGKNTLANVGGINLANVISKNNFTLGAGVIVIGNLNKQDEIWVYTDLKKDWKKTSLSLGLGHGFSYANGYRDYVLSRFSHPLFTVEGGFVSKKGYKNTSELLQDKYLWGAIHPEYFFAAAGVELSRNWFLISTKKIKNFGNLTLYNNERGTNNFWFRSQTGILDVSQGFFSQENCLVATSFLMIPPFFPLHFSPITTKGKISFKIDGARTGDLERWEMIAGYQINSGLHLAAGYQRETSGSKGLVFELYKEIKISTFKVLIETKYETMYSRLSGYITTSYNF